MQRALVAKATSTDEAPTPGYMYNEISRITHVSADACKQLEEFLLKRLKQDNVHQKIKVLRVIKHCCQQGHATFRRDMQRQIVEVKPCLGGKFTPSEQPPPHTNLELIYLLYLQSSAVSPIRCTAMR